MYSFQTKPLCYSCQEQNFLFLALNYLAYEYASYIALCIKRDNVQAFYKRNGEKKTVAAAVATAARLTKKNEGTEKISHDDGLYSPRELWVGVTIVTQSYDFEIARVK